MYATRGTNPSLWTETSSVSKQRSAGSESEVPSTGGYAQAPPCQRNVTSEIGALGSRHA